MAKMEFMDIENILANLENNDAYNIKDWYENYVCGGAEFERMADKLCDINEREFLWSVAEYINEEFDEDGLVEIIKEEGWDFEIPMELECAYDIENSAISCGFVNCTIKYKDSDKVEDVMIAVGITSEELEDEDSPYLYTDEDIFFYTEDTEDTLRLFNENNGEDFVIVGYDSFEE